MDRPAFRAGAPLAAATLAAVALCAGVTARAADWKVTPGIQVDETFTDNVALATGSDADRNSDLVTTVTPNVQLRGTGARGRLNLNYGLSEVMHRQVTERDDTRHNLLGAANAELWERIVFMDAQASINRQRVLSTGPTSGSVAGDEVNATTVRAFNVSPSLRHHFGTWVETESRIGVNHVSTESEDVEDTTTTSEQIRISSGRRFSTWLWALTGRSSKTSKTEEPAERRRNIDADFTYVLGPKLSLLAGIGHERVEDPTLSEPPRGMTWNAGFAARPSLRTSFRTTYGLRNDSKSLDFSGNHRLSERTTITASYAETIQTSQSLIADSLNFLTVDPTTGALIDSRTNLPFAGDSSFGLQDNSFRQERFQARLTGSRRRNTLSGGVFWEKRRTDATGVVETTTGGDMVLSRTLSRRSTGNLSLTYRHRDFGTEDERVDNEIIGSVAFRYQIFKDVDGTVAYNLTLRNTNNADEDLVENSVTVGLSKRF